MLNLICGFNAVGFISLAITVYIYEFIYRAKSILERCIFQLSLTLALTECIIFTHFLSLDKTSLLSWLSSVLHLIPPFILSTFSWSLVLAFHLWRTFQPRTGENASNVMAFFNNSESTSSTESISNDPEPISKDSELMNKYFIIGYGIPVLYILIGDSGFFNPGIVLKFMVFIVIVISYLSCALYINLSYRINETLHSHRSNVEMELDMKQIKYRQQFANKLFLSNVLPWIIWSIPLIIVFLFTDNSELMSNFLEISICFIGIQGLLLYLILMVFRKRIWRAIEAKYGWKKSPGLIKIENCCGNISEDDDEEEIMNNQTSLDLLALIYKMRQRNGAPNRQTNLTSNQQTNLPFNSSDNMSIP